METCNGFLYTRDVFVAHKDVVEDCASHVHNENLFSSVGDDHMLMIWDLLASDLTKTQVEDEFPLKDAIRWSPMDLKFDWNLKALCRQKAAGHIS